jgi:SAM-dependent methyltransferase
MSADNVRKFLQINHMLTLLQPSLHDMAQRHKSVRILDACCGNSYLAFLLAWVFTEEWHKECLVVGIDKNKKVIEQSRQRAAQLGFSGVMRFFDEPIDNGVWERVSEATDESPKPRPHIIVALHACDTATDAALSLAAHLETDIVAVAPCCQAELAAKWEKLSADHPLGPIFKTGNLRREGAALMTDTMRMLLMRSRGYEVTVTEFVPSEHTPKNRLLLCQRRGRYSRDAHMAYERFKDTLGGESILLESLLARDAGA